MRKRLRRCSTTTPGHAMLREPFGTWVRAIRPMTRAARLIAAPTGRLTCLAPASIAAASTAGSGRGQQAMTSPTPATRAGIAVISSDDGSGYRPPGT